jgi:Skp family chaperone for outer membrane proteins
MTPAERAHDATVELERGLDTLKQELGVVDGARVANQPTEWTRAKARLDSEFTRVNRARERVRAQLQSPELGTRIEEAERRFAAIKKTIESLGEPPSGITPLSVESQLLVILPSGPVADAQHEMPRIEAEVRRVVDSLSSADTLALQNRLKQNRQSDELVRRFRRLGGNRQAKLESWLGDDKRRASGPRRRRPAGDSGSIARHERICSTRDAAQLERMGSSRQRGARNPVRHDGPRSDEVQEAAD